MGPRWHRDNGIILLSAGHHQTDQFTWDSANHSRLYFPFLDGLEGTDAQLNRCSLSTHSLGLCGREHDSRHVVPLSAWLLSRGFSVHSGSALVMGFIRIMNRLSPYVPPTLSHLSSTTKLLHHWQYWCWISSKYEWERLAGEYVWLWTSLLTSVVMYIPLYLWAEGRLSVDKKKWYKFCLCSDMIAGEYPQRRAALGMLW
jgi:hypothetical protein